MAFVRGLKHVSSMSVLGELDVDGQRERALESVTASLSAAATREEILRSILRVGSEVLASSAAVAYLKSAEGEGLALVAHVGITDAVAAAVDGMPLASNYPVARAMREGGPVWIPSAETLDREFPEFSRAVDGAFARQSVVALPLRVGGVVVGGLGYAFPEAHAFNPGERSFLTTLAARCETAMERASLYEESQRCRAEAEALLRFHEVVSGILAHDLKNPLAAVLMNARILRTESSERARAIGARIVTSSERMARMIEQIVEWTRLRSKGAKLKLSRTSCDLGEIVGEIVSELRVHKGDVPIEIEANGDLRGSWDADRLGQAIQNVIGNGLEHATRPGVNVSLTGSADAVRLVVANEGQIDAARLPSLFEPFQLDGARPAQRRRGLGLGLFITREIVNAHDGRIEIQSAEGPRVAFVVTLPRAEAA
jgi:K+-sensing histidine kinase KdpD